MKAKRLKRTYSLLIASSVIGCSLIPIYFNNTKNAILESNQENTITLKENKIVNKKEIGVNTIVNKINRDYPEDVNLKFLATDLNNCFAQELLSKPLAIELKEIYDKFNKSLKIFINLQPSLFFNIVVDETTKPTNKPYIKSDSNLIVEIADKNNSKLKVTAEYLINQNGTFTYEPTSFIITGFRIDETKISTKNIIDISNFEDYKTQCGEVDIQNFLYPNKNNNQNWDPQSILIKLINKNITNLYNNSFKMTTCIEIKAENVQLDYVNNQIIIQPIIENYVGKGGNLIFKQFDTSKAFVKVLGFAKSVENIPTAFKNGGIFSIEEIQNKYQQDKFNFPILGNLNFYFVEELIDSGGIYNDLFRNELTNAINTDRNFWLDGPINDRNISIVDADYLSQIKEDKENDNKAIKISIKILTNPRYVGQQMSEAKFKNLTFTINSSVDSFFGKTAPANGNTSFITSSETTIYSLVKDINFFEDSNLTSLNNETINSYYVNDKTYLINLIKKNILSNLNTLFVNCFKVKDLILPRLTWSNNELSFEFQFNKYFKNGEFIDAVNNPQSYSDSYTLTLNGITIKNKDENNVLKISIIVSSSVILILAIALVIFLVIRNKKKRNNVPDHEININTYDDWKD